MLVEIGFTEISIATDLGKYGTDMAIESFKPINQRNVELAQVGKFPMFLFSDKDCCLCQLMRSGKLERHEAKSMQKYVKAGDTVIEVGGHIGFFTLLLADLVGPLGTVHVFEPDKINFQVLCRNVETNKFVTVQAHQMVVANQNGETIFFRSIINTGDNRIWNDPGEDGIWPRSKVKTVRLDDALPNGTNPSFMKIDAQGCELDVLLGGIETIRRQKRLVIDLEYWPTGLAGMKRTPDDLMLFLHQEGFDVNLIDVDSGDVSPVDIENLKETVGKTQFVNLLCIKKERE